MRVFIVLSILALGASPIFGQGIMHRPTIETESSESEGHFKLGGSLGTRILRGSVVLADGGAPKELVTLYAECGGSRIFAEIADSKGAFRFNPDSPAAVDARGKARLVSVPGAQIESLMEEEFAQPEIPGVTKIVVAGELAAGTRMIWKTELLAAPKEAGSLRLGTSMEMR